MTAPIHDGELAASYARHGEEGAFRALVARHVDLVFATALRQVGDRGMAEEITQNVFVALARKAGSLRGYETLAGWLHRTTILEAKARIRSELRRQQREQTAAEIAEIQNDGTSPLAPLVPLLDEALLSLRDNDRTALVARFLEDRSLREVGTQIGVDEDAARKRVSRALDRLADFFRARGFALPAGTGIAALFPLAVEAAPPALTLSAAQAGLAAGTAAGGFGLTLLNIMALSKTKTLVASALLVSAPLMWQARTGAELSRQQDQLAAAVQQEEESLARLTRELEEARERLRRTTAERYAAEARTAELRAIRQNQAPPPRYQWDDLSPLARIPKDLLLSLDLSTFENRTGKLNDHMKEVLQLTPAESADLQAALDNFFAKVHAAQQATMRYIRPDPHDPATGTEAEERVFEIGDTTETVRTEREKLFAQTSAILGEDRFPVWKKGLHYWMPISPEEDETGGVSSMESVTPAAHTVTFRHEPYNLHYGMKVGSSSVGVTINPDEVSPLFEPYLRDWLEKIRSNRDAIQANPPR